MYGYDVFIFAHTENSILYMYMYVFSICTCMYNVHSVGEGTVKVGSPIIRDQI